MTPFERMRQRIEDFRMFAIPNRITPVIYIERGEFLNLLADPEIFSVTQIFLVPCNLRKQITALTFRGVTIRKVD